MGRFFETENYTTHNEILDAVRELAGEFPEIFTDFEVSASIPRTTGSIALFVGDNDVICVDTYMGDDGVEYAIIEPWVYDVDGWWAEVSVSADDANEAVAKVLHNTNALLGYRFVPDIPDATIQSCDVEPGEDEDAIRDFLAFANNSAGEIVRVECTELNAPGEWPVVARFVVETRNDDGVTEIVHWSVQKARV